MKKLMYKGSKTNGKKIIQLLEQAGGINSKNLNGNDIECYYFIGESNSICEAYTSDEKWLASQIFELVEIFSHPFSWRPKIGDPMLVKNNIDDIWDLRSFYDYTPNYTYPYRSLQAAWRFAIPYNDDTKHLLGVQNDHGVEYIFIAK